MASQTIIAIVAGVLAFLIACIVVSFLIYLYLTRKRIKWDDDKERLNAFTPVMFRPQKEKTGISYLVRAVEEDKPWRMRQTENGAVQTKPGFTKRHPAPGEDVHQMYTPVDMSKKRKEMGIQRHSEVVMIENEDIYDSNDNIANEGDDTEEIENGITTKANVINEQYGDIVMYENEDVYEGTNSDKSSDIEGHNDGYSEDDDDKTYEDVENTSAD